MTSDNRASRWFEQQFGLHGHTALITGGAGGLGTAHAHALGRAGARVIIAEPDASRVDAATARLDAEGIEAAGVTMDVRDVASIDLAMDELDERGLAASILVNNAGVSVPSAALEATERDFDQTFDINAKGVYFVARAAAERMRHRGGGSIIHISSIGAHTIDGERSSVYDASKAAVAHMTTSMAYEWAPFGIRVNAIAPGYIHTSMTEQFLADRQVESELVRSRIPLGRVGEPTDLAGALIYLCSPSASWVTGHSLVVDGGWMANF